MAIKGQGGKQVTIYLKQEGLELLKKRRDAGLDTSIGDYITHCMRLEQLYISGADAELYKSDPAAITYRLQTALDARRAEPDVLSKIRKQVETIKIRQNDTAREIEVGLINLGALCTPTV
mgnify:CR=1 FL=1